MHRGFCYTYIVASRSLTLYLGMTGNLHKRIFEHKKKIFEGFSATYNCNRSFGLSDLLTRGARSQEKSN
ncbi:MAG: hypothetical protein WDM87_01755 [Terracidiphilus sp.]